MTTNTPEMQGAVAAEKLCERYEAIRDGEWACRGAICQFPHYGQCECFNTALSESMEQVRLSGKLEAEREIVAWLRDGARVQHAAGKHHGGRLYGQLAEAIERGDHEQGAS